MMPNTIRLMMAFGFMITTILLFSWLIVESRPAFAIGVDSIRPSTPILKSPYSPSPPIVASTVGEQVVISVVATNNASTDIEYVMIVEVWDSNDITWYLTWQSGVLRAGEETEIGISWLPQAADTYKIIAHPITNFENPQALGERVDSTFVISD